MHSAKPHLLSRLVATLAVLASSALAQLQFEELAKRHLPLDQDLTSAVALGDVDLDGDHDLVFANWGQNRLYLNLLRQLDGYARYGPPRNSDVAVILLSTGTAHLPLPPYGIFGLDPMRMVGLPALPVPQPAGTASVSLLVPNAPLLAGLSIYAQPVLVQDPVGIYLTNVTADRIVR